MVGKAVQAQRAQMHEATIGIQPGRPKPRRTMETSVQEAPVYVAWEDSGEVPADELELLTLSEEQAEGRRLPSRQKEQEVVIVNHHYVHHHHHFHALNAWAGPR